MTLSSCQEEATLHGPISSLELFDGEAFAIPYRIQLAAYPHPIDRSKIERLLETTFAEIDHLYNKWNPQSELSQLNRAEADQAIPLSPPLYQFLERVATIVAMTEGRFDPTVETLQRLWRPFLEKGQEPSLEAQQQAALAMGWHQLELRDGCCTKRKRETALDLGGIAKGYGVDLLVERMTQAGYADLYVEWGGEIRCQGLHPEGRPWRVFISRLGSSDPAQAIALVELRDRAIATSGDYLQSWKVGGGQERCHIYDIAAKTPLLIGEGTIASVSVAAPTCFEADGLATALMTFPSASQAHAWAEALQQQREGLAFWIVTRPSLQTSIANSPEEAARQRAP